MKKVCIIFALVFLVFLALGIWVNTQVGISFGGMFWQSKGDGEYAVDNGMYIKHTNDGAKERFAISLGSKKYEAVMTPADDDLYHFEFSDGWSTDVNIYFYRPFRYLFDEAKYTREITIKDMDAMGLRFSKEPNEIGIDFPKRVVTLKNGMVFSESDNSPYLYSNVFKNEKGEYLLDEKDLFFVKIGANYEYRTNFAGFLFRIIMSPYLGEGEPRGSIKPVISYVILYALGLVLILWPQRMAHLVTSWMYETEPKLNENGIAVHVICGVMIMIIGIVKMLRAFFVF